MTWEKNDTHNAIVVAAGFSTGMLIAMSLIFYRWVLLDYTISSLGWVLLVLLIFVTGLCIAVALGYVVEEPSHTRIPTYSHPRFAKPETKETVETIVHQALCGITYEKSRTDQASDVILAYEEISVTATTPEDVERLYKFVEARNKSAEEGE